MKSSTLGNGAWLLVLLISLMFSMIMGLGLVWISIDRNDTVYAIRQLQIAVENAEEHCAKLEVERDSLLSPYELGVKAKQLGMGMADPGQVRRLEHYMSPGTADTTPQKEDGK